jgi:3'-phosphoadenosine 5'-phosphosulfate sulfotransferase (PAPS reductase)/FAD synthetase
MALEITAVFCDTKWEHEINYQHIKYVGDKLEVEFVNLVF